MIAVCWGLSSLIPGPIGPQAASPDWHWSAGPITLGRPIVTSGDSPHYLLIVNSLIEDLDFDLANNHRQARLGDWDAGARHRGSQLVTHVETDKAGRQLSFHPFFRPLLYSLMVWPWRTSEWVESLCIWLTMAGTLAGVAAFRRCGFEGTKWPLLLALATPLWFYAGDLWNEPWLATAWVLLLTVRSPKLLGAVAFAGSLIKYSFMVVPMTMAVVAAWRGEWKRAGVLGGAAAAAVLVAIAATQWIFAQSDHFDLFHVGARHLTGAPGFGLSPIDFMSRSLGLMFDPRSGLLPFAPFLAWGFWQFRKGGDWYAPALVFFALHAGYAGWDGGAGYSARFLVPTLPVMVKAVADANPRGRLFQLAVLYSFVCAFVAGTLPIAAFDRAPWEAILFLYREATVSLGLGS